MVPSLVSVSRPLAVDLIRTQNGQLCSDLHDSCELQEVTDAEGRRRFHGAFTGGYSAGYFNTVGSLEGWQPKAFRSSRDKRAGDR